jgi:transposase
MKRKVKYNYAFKLRCVEEVIKKHQTVSSVCIKNGLDRAGLRNWIRVYLKYGKEGLLPRQRNQKYNVAFKLKVLQTITKKSLSLSEACLTFNIPAKSTIISWQRKHKEDGLTGLELKPKGKPTSMNFKRKQRKSDKPLTREEELLRENEYLRAENELLKKFNALVQAEQANQNKKLKP